MITVCKSGMIGNCLVWKILKRSEVFRFGNVFGAKTTFCKDICSYDLNLTRAALYLYSCTVNY